MPQWSDDAAASLLRELGVHGMGGINPDASQLLDLLRSDGEGPLQLAQPPRLRARRDPEDHELAKAGLSGLRPTASTGPSRWTHVVRRGAPSCSTTTWPGCWWDSRLRGTRLRSFSTPTGTPSST